jgi:DNA replication protein DnaC
MGSVQLRNLMQDLKLDGMLLNLERTLKLAEKESLTTTDILDHLLQAEYAHREELASGRRLKASKLEKLPALEDFDFSVKRSLTKTQIKDLYSMKWLEQGRPMILIGPTGVGKTPSNPRSNKTIELSSTSFSKLCIRLRSPTN